MGISNRALVSMLDAIRFEVRAASQLSLIRGDIGTARSEAWTVYLEMNELAQQSARTAHNWAKVADEKQTDAEGIAVD